MTPLSFETPDCRCLNCEAHVTSRFCRVFGDENDVAHRCTECDTYIRISKGSAAGLDVGVPDPEIAEGRHGGEPA